MNQFVGEKTGTQDGPSDSEELDDQFLRLDVQLCFALHASARAIARVYMEVLRKENLTYPQYLVLITLLEKNGQTVSEIGRQLHLDSGTLTPLLKRMRAEKFLTKKRSSEDEREVQVWLTAKGKRLRGVAKRARQHVVEKLDMTDHQIIKLRKQLMDMAGRLNQTELGD